MIKKSSSFLVLLAIIVVSVLGFLDQTILPVALPTIQLDFHATEVELQWMINVYFLTLALFVLAAGRLSDIFGKRFILSWGIALFCIGSLFSGLSFSSQTLIWSRILQGIGSALIIPPSIPILFEAFEEKRHGHVMGIGVAASSTAMIIGPFVGGLFTQYLSWRYAFLVNVPIALFAFLLVLLFVPKSKKNKESFDFFGFLLFALAAVSINIVIIQAKEWGLLSFSVLLLLFFGIVLIWAFFRWSRKVRHPLFSFELFKDHFFAFSNANIFVTAFVLMLAIYWTIYMQDILGFSPSLAGIYSMLSSLPIVFMPIVGGKLSDRFGPKVPWLLGNGMLIISLIWILVFLPMLNFWAIFPALCLFTAGITCTLTVSFAKGVSGVVPEKRGVANGILSTVRQAAAALGTAFMGAIILNFQHFFFFKGMAGKHISSDVLNIIEDELLIGTGQKILSQEFVDIFNFSYEKGFFIAHAAALFLAFIIFCALFKHRKYSGK